MATRRVKFIGKTAFKKDNVCRTDLFWPYRGAIVECQEDIAVRLYAHPDVWVEPDADDEGKPMTESPLAKLDQNLTREEKIQIAIEILEEEDAFGEVNAYLGENLLSVGLVEDDETQTGGDNVDSSPEGGEGEGLGDVDSGADSDQKPAAQPAPVAGFSNDRGEAIVQAINLLDRDNEEHFTKDNTPRVEAIEGLLGYDISASERTAAWDAIQADEGN